MSVTSNDAHFLWVEKYRPTKVDDTILPTATKEMVKGYLDQGRIPNLLFAGGAGVGKTTLARAMCEEVGCDYIVVNASSENGIDTLRTKITNFASSVSFSDARKVVILDEADNMSRDFQAAFRNSMEAFSENCTFILTCNYPNRLIDAIHSRCSVVNFAIKSSDRPVLASQFFKRVCQILSTEGVEFDKKVVAELVNKYFPDFRRCLNELQKFSATGKIDSVILVNLDENVFGELVTILKNKKFNEMRKWVATNPDIDSVQFFRMFYDMTSEKVEASSIPEIVVMLGQYQYYASQVADQELNRAAFLTEILSSTNKGSIVWK